MNDDMLIHLVPTPDAPVTMPRRLALMLVSAFWESQWETANAAENTVCAFGCGEPYKDFVAHEPRCAFLAWWDELHEIRAAVGFPLVPEVMT